MKSCIAFIITLATCFSPVFAETTVELIQQRAEAGDATAQTLMGLMTFYGYQVSRDADMSESWFQQAADQGDAFASGRIAMVKKRSSASSSTNSIKSKSTYAFSLSKEELEKKVSSASSAEYAGSIDMDNLVLKRADYVGKVIQIKFMASSINTKIGENPYLHIYKTDNDYVGSFEYLMLCGQKALEWAVGISKQGYGATGTVYALVEDKNLVALGVRKSKIDDGYTYSW